MKKTLEHIINIGKGESSIEISEFLPSYPTIRGSENIFKINWRNSKGLLHLDVINLVKGLHKIELEYRRISNNDFGFGSPSPTHKIIIGLRSQDIQLADELHNWINSNGGNYYIKGPKQRNTNQRHVSGSIFSIDEQRKIKKQQIQLKHRKILEKQTERSNKRKALLELSFAELTELMNNDQIKPIHYFEEAILSKLKDGLSESNKISIIENIEIKYLDKYPKKTRQIIKKIKAPDNK
jgi:hypothetical protein